MVNSSNTITSNTTTNSIISTNASTMSTSISTSANIITTSTSATDTSTGTSTSTTDTSTISITTTSTSTGGSTTTTNICNGGYTYVTQLLYLSLNSPLSWTKYTFNYTAPNVTAAKLTFSFRNDPGYWYLDDVSVTNSSGGQLLSNGDFEQGTLVNWVYCNPSNATFSGAITGAVSNTGWYSYEDGSVGAPDYLSQTFSVRPNNKYTVSFWLGTNSYNMTFGWITISA